MVRVGIGSKGRSKSLIKGRRFSFGNYLKSTAIHKRKSEISTTFHSEVFHRAFTIVAVESIDSGDEPCPVLFAVSFPVRDSVYVAFHGHHLLYIASDTVYIFI